MDLSARRRTSDVQQAFMLACWGSASLALLASVAAITAPDMQHAAIGLWAATVVLAPLTLEKRLDPFSPWTIVTLSVLLGCTLRGVYISFELPDPDTIDFLFLQGEDPSYFFKPGLILLAGLVALSAGYITAQAMRRPRPQQPIVSRWRRERLVVVCGGVLVLALTSTYYFIKYTGGFESELISAKRTNISDIDISYDSEYRGYGMLRRVGKLALYAHLAMLSHVMTTPRDRSPLMIGITAALFVAACLIPFYSSVRSEVAMAVLCTIAVTSYLSRRIPWGKLLPGVALAVLLLAVMTSLRPNGEDRWEYDSSGRFFQFLDPLVVNRNHLGIAKTAHIINAVPSVLDVQYGRTIAAWVTAPVPRSVWPNKPLVHTGPIIGNLVYGNRISGVPPSLIAELYWNFLLPGVLIGCFIFGAVLRLLYDRLSPRNASHPAPLLLHVVGPMSSGMLLISVSVGAGLFNMALDMALMSAVLLALGRPRRAAAARRRLSPPRGRVPHRAVRARMAS